MKKSFVLTLALVIWTGLLVTSVFGAGTVTVTTKNLDNGKMQLVQFAWVADASNGSVPATTLTGQQLSSLTGAYLCGGETIPGSGAAAPTALYDVTWVAGQANQTLAQWVQSRVTELDLNCVAQVKNAKAKETVEKVGLYDRLDAKDKADVDVIFAKAQAAKEAEEAAKVEEPIVEGEVK